MSTVKEQLQEILDTIKGAIANQEWQKAEPYISENWISFQNGAQITWEEQKNMFRKHITNHKSTFSKRDWHISDNGSMAWCTAVEDTEYMFDDEKVKENALFTTIWEKEGGNWKMIHLSRSVNPAQIPSKLKKEMEAAL